MGMNMAGNLHKNGFVVKGYDMNEATREKAKEHVSLITALTITEGNHPCKNHR